jgi:hypothetical protein
MKGITLLPHGKYQAQIWVDKKYRYLGSFDTQEEANAAYANAAISAHGEFARFD